MIVYKITNLINNKVYIGQTTKTIEQRFEEHCKNGSQCRAIKNAIKKYGKDNFKIEAIENCKTLDELNKQEEYWIAHYNSLVPNGYNLQSGGRNHVVTEETRKKLSEAAKGEKNYWYGKHLSEEIKQKLRVANLGKKQSEKTKTKRSEKERGELNHFYGKHHNEITKKKISESRMKYVGINHPRCKKVQCIETGKIYPYIRAAQNDTGVSECHISSCCKGKLKTAGGYHWKLFEEDELK